MLFCLVLVFIIVYAAYLYNKRKRTHLSERKSFRETLLKTQLEIQEQTFSQIAQELHDNIGQSITFARMNLGSVNDLNTTSDGEKVKNTNEILLQVLTDIRHLSRSMLGEKIAAVGTENSLRNQIKYITGNAFCTVTISNEGTTFLLPPQTEIFTFRIVQEVLNNIIKHAGATQIDILFSYHPEDLVIQVQDNGESFTPEDLPTDKQGLGLINIYNRSRLINGNIQFLPLSPAGTRFTLTIPKPLCS